MRSRLIGAFVGTGLGLVAVDFPTSARQRVITVRMVDGVYAMAYDPPRVTAVQGDTVRFVQAGRLPHNVEFRSVPAGVDLGDLAKGPFIEKTGATYDVVIDARFQPGRYVYVCTPHEVMGMAGIITVTQQ
jgi:plastocyanin